MRLEVGALGGQRWIRHGVPWLGALFIAAIVALAVWDVVRGYRISIDDTGRELETQARILAEQTARSVQAVDVVLRHVAGEFKRGRLATLSPQALHAYLREQAVGLVQIDGLALHDADGDAMALSWREPGAAANVATLPSFTMLRDESSIGLGVGAATISPSDGLRVLPFGRRLETAGGAFAGVVGGRGRIEYFQEFYRDVQLDRGTQVALIHGDGSLLARYPAAPDALGRRYELFDTMLVWLASGQAAPLRLAGPPDGVERFGTVRLVPDYPLAVIVTRDAALALAPWRAQATGTALRTLALALLAAALLGVLRRQLNRLDDARQTLEASQERFALAVDGSDDGIWDWDFRTRSVFASPRARELLGLAHGPATQPMGQWFESLEFHPDDGPRRQAAMQAHFDGEAPAYAGEFRVRHPDGGYRWVRIRGLCVRDAGGKPIRMAGSVSDIDDRKRAEEALRQSEERFALAVAGANDGILDWDMVADRMFASARALRMVGLDPDARIRTRREWTALLMPRMHPDDAERLRDELRGLHGALDMHAGEYRVRDADGVYRWIRLRGRTVRDAEGRAIRWAGSLSDVDAQKRTEQALRDSEQRYELAVAGSNQGLWDWDMASDTVFFSARGQQLIGDEPVAAVRPRHEWLDRWTCHPDDLARVRQALADYLHGRHNVWEVEYRLLHRSGEWHWYLDRGVALRDAGGRPYRMAGSLEDITERKAAQAGRDRLEQQLRQAQKLEAMGTLAGGIAHDFNNILAAILGYGEMAQKDAPEGSTQRRHIDAAMAAGQRAKSLVERILAFSRSGMGERAPVHVQSVVDEALDAIAASLPPGVRLEREVGAGSAAVLGEATQIHQVVMNLCANAVQAIGSAGTLAVSAGAVELERPQQVSTSALAAGPYLKLVVRDSGVGIAPRVLERIFDPFFTTKEVGVGTGLGLSLVHGIVTDLGGGIDVDSRLGEGTTMTVWLPRSDDVAAPAVAERPDIAGGAGETVLLVDDEEPLVRLGEELLAGLGYEPVGFASSLAALEAFRAEPDRFDLVLSDESMPELTGSELAREIRRLRPALPVVLMTGHATAALAARARDIGVAEVLAKPLAAGDIARCLAGALRRADSGVALAA